MEFYLYMKSGRLHKGFFKQIVTLDDMLRLIRDSIYIQFDNIAVNTSQIESVRRAEPNEGKLDNIDFGE